MHISTKRIFSNATANLFAGLINSIYNIILPGIIISYFSKQEFSAWTLGLQMYVYVQVLTLGINTAIAKFISSEAEVGEDISKTVLAGFMSNLAIFFVSTIVVFLFSSLYPTSIYKELDDIHRLTTVCFIFGLSATFQTFGMLPIGVFTGLHKSLVHVSVQAIFKLLCVLFVFAAVQLKVGFTSISIILAICVSANVPVLYYLLYIKVLKYFSVNFLTFERNFIIGQCKQLFYYCKPLALWSICTLSVNGLQLLLVGYFQPEQVSAFSLSLTLITTFIGLVGAGMSPLVTAGSALYAEKNNLKLNELTWNASLITAILLLCIIIGYWLIGDYFISLWVGNGYAAQINSIMPLFLTSVCIRTLILPLAMLQLATYTSSKTSLPAIAEASLCLILSICLGPSFGIHAILFSLIASSIVGLILGFKYIVNNIIYLENAIKKNVFILLCVSVFVYLALYVCFFIL